MFNFGKRKASKPQQVKYKPVSLFLVVLALCLIMGSLLADATNAQTTIKAPTSEIGTVDVIPAQYKLGQELYLENCSSCHIAIPPAVFPSQTWKNLLEDSQHYGAQLKPLVDPPRTLVWRYLSTYSRSLQKDEETPYRFHNSRYFKALHPQVKLPQPIPANSCVTCHPGASNYNFRSLTKEFGNGA
ncbi:cytochrome C [Brunnivagina elsteri]|uniref:Cytochrome C n=1 Tax=Brunnivagina elsteri CCALA 953 TaxID=987040 RepID=A0A2A2TEM1_9CYAN|nr:cytochrome C [Calothrix elsteri]PAX52096.1 cytochrome C [Calothrix elsteri CCALA 953]